jgi:hypothetical protein
MSIDTLDVTKSREGDMRQGWRAGAVAAVAAVVGLTGSPASAATSPASAATSPASAATDSGWTLEPVAVGSADVAFNGVAAVSSKELLAVGWQRDRLSPTGQRRIDIRRRSATGRWDREPVAGVGQLDAVASVSPREAWAVGWQSGITSVPLAYWLYSGGWRRIPTAPVPGGGALHGVAALSSLDAWAVGEQQGKFGPDQLIQHCDGNAWRSMQISPFPADADALYGVTAIAANDVWAVGARHDLAGSKPFAVHWDGARWAQIAVPAPAYAADLRAVSAVSGKDVWAVGGNGVIAHYDGTRWSLIGEIGPAVPGPTRLLTGVSARSATDVWAVGLAAVGSISQSVTRHWDGKQWLTVAGPNPGKTANALYGVVTPRGGDTHVVGGQTTDGVTVPLVARR